MNTYFSPPPSLTGTEKQQLAQLRSFLFRLTEQLNVSLAEAAGDAGSETAETKQEALEKYNALRKTIVKNAEGIGALQSGLEDALTLSGLTEIPDGANLDAYLDFGAYSVPSTARAETITGLPEAKPGRLVVYSTMGTGFTVESGRTWNYITQEYYPHTKSYYYKRILHTTNDSTVFTPESWSVVGTVIELLWENASPNSAYASQTLSLGIGEYDMLLISFKQMVSSSWFMSNVLIPRTLTGSNVTANDTRYDGAVINTRRYVSCDFSADTVFFGVGKQNGADKDAVMMPYRIYGIRGAVV